MENSPPENAFTTGAHIGNIASQPEKRSLWARIESGPILTLATVLFVASTGIMLLEGLSRSLFGVSYFWAEESVRFLMIWAFFLSLGIAGTRGHHIRTELFVDRLQPATRRIMHMIASLIGVVFSLLLFYAAIPQIHRYYTMGMISESSLDIPVWVVFLAMPIGAAIYFAYYLGCLVRAIKGENPFPSNHGPTGAEL